VASTAGRKAKPLPPSIIDGLEQLGYRLMPYNNGGTPIYRHPSFPKLYASVVVSNLPGDEHVIAQWNGQTATRMHPDAFVDALRTQLAALRSHTQPMPKEADHG